MISSGIRLPVADNVLLVYSDTTGLRYKTSSDRGTTWGSQQNVSTSYQAYWVQLERSVNDTIYLAIHDNADDLRTWIWASSTWTAKNTITTDLETGYNSNREVEVFALSSLPLNISEFEYRSPITINYSQRGTDCPVSGINLPNFPVLISLTDNRLKAKTNGGNVYHPNGFDIVFRAADGITQLDHEIERYTGSTGELIAWVKIPYLFQGDANTSIYIYYGNPAITVPTANPGGVWDGNYAAVYHMNQDPSGTVFDSTGNNIDLTSEGTMTAANLVGGQIGNAISFVGSDYADRLVSTNTFTTTSFTIEAWISNNATGYWPSYQCIVDLNEIGVDSRDFTVYDDVSDGNLCVDNDSFSPSQISGQQSGTAWRHVVATYTSGSPGPVRGFINGAITSYTPSESWSSITGRVIIGAWWYNDYPDFYDFWDGEIDEVRISTNARDNCWIQTGYNNMSTPGAFITLGTEGAAAPTAVTLKSFTATQYSEGILLRWKTGYEVNNLGFHVYREENGQLVRLTPEPVAGSAFLAGKGTLLTAGHHYHWWDAQHSTLGPRHSPL